MDNIRYILWTGGLDSTFMLLLLARTDITIQPIYVIDPNRKSIQFELNAMNNIMNMLATKYSKDVKAHVLPIKTYEMKDIVANEYISDCYERLSKHLRIGTQYEWLSRLASMYPFLDIGVEKHFDGYGGCTTAIMNDGGFVSVNGIGKLNADNSSEETIALFGKFRFPIMNYTNVDMMTIVHTWGWDEMIKQTWFCHEPIDGKPCGMCRPCQQKMEDRMECLLPVEAQRRYKLFNITKHVFGAYTAERAVRLFRHLFK